jgi:hypothetical protein
MFDYQHTLIVKKFALGLKMGQWRDKNYSSCRRFEVNG